MRVFERFVVVEDLVICSRIFFLISLSKTEKRFNMSKN